MEIRVQSETFRPGEELDAFTVRVDGAGAVVSFTGIVRDDTGALSEMVIEHYPGMTERALEKITTEACERWSLVDALVIHRFGPLGPSEQIMMVATAARHRKDAFEAAEFLMDYLKSRAPFWKKERNRDSETWVEAKDSDEDALTRW